MRHFTFHDICTAPKDATPIEVRHGPDRVIALAKWNGQAQAWIRIDDPHRKTLHWVRDWRPINHRGEKAVPL